MSNKIAVPLTAGFDEAATACHAGNFFSVGPARIRGCRFLDEVCGDNNKHYSTGRPVNKSRLVGFVAQ